MGYLLPARTDRPCQYQRTLITRMYSRMDPRRELVAWMPMEFPPPPTPLFPPPPPPPPFSLFSPFFLPPLPPPPPQGKPLCEHRSRIDETGRRLLALPVWINDEGNEYIGSINLNDIQPDREPWCTRIHHGRVPALIASFDYDEVKKAHL